MYSSKVDQKQILMMNIIQMFIGARSDFPVRKIHAHVSHGSSLRKNSRVPSSKATWKTGIKYLK